MPNILLELSQLARDAGVDLESISPGQQTPVNGQMTIPITLNVGGDFYTVTDMLDRLRAAVPRAERACWSLCRMAPESCRRRRTC